MITIVIALIIIATIAIVAYPLFSQAQPTLIRAAGASDNVLEELVHQRNAAYSAIKDLENEHALGKLSDADYRSLRVKYEAKAAAILQELDNVMGAKPSARAVRDDDAIEREIARLRHAKANGALKCPQCGTPHTAEEVFCAKCGAALRGTRCPACGTRATAGDKFCAKCGKPL